ncbi:MAG: divergent polysaccharide deacetylase family protein [Campylobacterota bacterium]|nr:divergent polysaccharide deacetylase family protein [Campylobacterota bacterium]
MAKRKKRTTKSNSKVLTYIAWVLAVIALIMSSLVAGYYFGFSDAKEDALKKEKLQKQKRISLLKKLEESNTKRDSVNNRLKKVLKKEVLSQKHKTQRGASHEYNGDALTNPPKRVSRDLKRLSTKPKLAIIIDDVSVRSHVEAIKAIGIPLTMSFLPPSKSRPNSAKLASKESFYMVHLPMEAMNFNKEEPFTLYANDSQRTISNRIRELKKLFPRVKYINNHTGSKFTSSEVAMNRLILALNDQRINFIDSRTTAETKAPKVMKNYGLNYVARDVFLDHRMDKPYIKSQIKKAIKIAKLHGSAIAIGHPHANTILALSESKKYFDEVELVYINRLY